MDELECRMRQVLAEMSVISEQPAHPYDGVQVSGGDKTGVLRLVARPMLDEFRDRWNGAMGPTSRRSVVQAAEEALELARRNVTEVQGLEPARGSFAWKCRVADATGDVGDVATWWGVHRTTVLRYRRSYAGLLRRVPSDGLV